MEQGCLEGQDTWKTRDMHLGDTETPDSGRDAWEQRQLASQGPLPPHWGTVIHGRSETAQGRE